MEIKLTKEQLDIIQKGNMIAEDKPIYYNPFYYMSTKKDDVFKVLRFKELSPVLQNMVIENIKSELLNEK